MNRAVLDQVDRVTTNIKKVRLYKGYTQEYVAMKMGCSQNTYSKIELGAIKLTVMRLLEVADILEVDTSALL
jgi:transcriptional regulator with XRE-family HTH domain